MKTRKYYWLYTTDTDTVKASGLTKWGKELNVENIK